VKVLQPELKRKRRGDVEIIALRLVTLRGYATRQRKERSSARRKGGWLEHELQPIPMISEINQWLLGGLLRLI
jgi:hypothetical protein